MKKNIIIVITTLLLIVLLGTVIYQVYYTNKNIEYRYYACTRTDSVIDDDTLETIVFNYKNIIKVDNNDNVVEILSGQLYTYDDEESYRNDINFYQNENELYMEEDNLTLYVYKDTTKKNKSDLNTVLDKEKSNGFVCEIQKTI